MIGNINSIYTSKAKPILYLPQKNCDETNSDLKLKKKTKNKKK